jgi:osmotically-inducible protein OsmY
MEHYDQRGGSPNEGQRNRSREEEEGRGRGSWRDDERDSQRSEQRGEEYDRDRSDRSRFSPDWSRQGAQPRHSDEEYYARNRERGGSSEYSRGGEQGRESQRGRDESQESHYRGYYRSSATPFSYGGGSGMLYSESLTLHGPYTGRGPKGYKRSDQQILEEACQRLERDGEIDASEIEVTAEDGVIRLRGTVQDRMTKRRAEECVESVYGTRDVMNELRVSSQSVGKSQSQGSQSSGASMRASGSEQSGTDKKSSKL